MWARNPHAGRPRFPQLCESAGGQSGPNADPKGEVDGQQVNIPVPARIESDGGEELVRADGIAR